MGLCHALITASQPLCIAWNYSTLCILLIRLIRTPMKTARDGISNYENFASAAAAVAAAAINFRNIV